MGEVWAQKWTITDRLGKGGQGGTFIVESILNRQKGVLKKLKNNTNPQARKRFFIETDALDLLNGSDALVPKVLDSNREAHQCREQPYFVMEQIDGTTLSNIVATQGQIFSRQGDIHTPVALQHNRNYPQSKYSSS